MTIGAEAGPDAGDGGRLDGAEADVRRSLSALRRPHLVDDSDRPVDEDEDEERPASGWLDPIPLQWVDESVVRSCSIALRRLGGAAASPLAVTSSVRREGRSTVAIGCALVQRNEYGRRTVLIDLDVERPALARWLSTPPGPTLADVLEGRAALDDAVVTVGSGFGVLVAGEAAMEPAHFLTRFARSAVLGQLAEAGYSIVADLPPLPAVGCADRVANAFPACLLVVRAGSTSVDLVRAATSHLDRPPAVLLNGKRSSLPSWLRPTSGQ